MQQKPTIPPFVEVDITVDKVKAGFKIWKERTSTSPSGQHLGLYKVWLQKANEDKNILSEDKFFGLINQMMNLAVKANYTPYRWWLIYNLYLLKEVSS